MEVITQKVFSQVDYLEYEESTSIRNELFKGNLKEMAGGSIYHERVIMNLGFILKMALGTKGYNIFMSGLKVRIDQETFFYPDIIVTPETFANKYFAENPVLIAEVLSPSTRSFDMVEKFIAYRSISGLKTYLLIEPEYYHVTLYLKDEKGNWQSDTFRKLDQQISLSELDLVIPLSSIYEGLTWD